MNFIERKKKAAKRLAVTSALAAAAGYVAGLLTAPTSGKQARQTIKKTANKSYSEAEKDLKQVNSELTKVLKDTKDSTQKLSARAQKELDELVEKAKDTKEKGREMLSALHEGGAEDKDLRKAIKDANAALQHLRDYIKK
jgi:gas vesicle protein